MEISDYISWVYSDQEKESKYQLVRFRPTLIKKTRKLINHKWVDTEILLNTEEEMRSFASDYTLRLILAIPTRLYEFLEYHYSKYIIKNPGQELDFLHFIEQSTDHVSNITATKKDEPGGIIKIGDADKNRIKLITNWVEDKREKLTAGVTEPGNPVEKIKWNGSSEILGFLFLELVRKGYIDPPLFHGKPNFTGLSRLCGQYFEVGTTPGNLERVFNEENNALTTWKRERFTIPPLSEIA